MNKPRLTVVVSDQQAPFHDTKLHEVTVDFLARHKPSRLLVLGDLVDLPSLRRFERDPYETEYTVKDSIDAGKSILADYSKAAGRNCVKVLFEGNHEKRLGLRILNSPNVSDLHEYLSIPEMLESGRMGYRWIGGYPNTQYMVSDTFTARHGWLIRSDSGASVLATLKSLRYSVIVGHTHRLGVVHLTQHNVDGSRTILTGVENGTMCDPSKLTYAVAANWQQGFTLLWTYDDGNVRVEQVMFDGAKLIY